MSSIILAALRLLCTHCHQQTYYSPPLGGSQEVEIGYDVCGECQHRGKV